MVAVDVDVSDQPYRLTMSTPFGEEDTSADVQARVASREVQWGLLQQFGVSKNGKLPLPISPGDAGHSLCLQEWTLSGGSLSTTPASE